MKRAILLCLALAVAVSTAIAQETVGGWNLVIGVGGGWNLTTGSYNFCIGDNSCPKITTQNCQVDVRPLDIDKFNFPHEELAFRVQVMVEDVRLFAVLDDSVCGRDPRRLAAWRNLQSQFKKAGLLK